MKQKIHNKNLPQELKAFYSDKNREIQNAHKEFAAMQGSDHPSDMKDHMNMNGRLFKKAMQQFEKRQKRIEFEWMEPNLVRSSAFPKLNIKRQRSYLDFRYDYWFVNDASL